MQRNFSVDDILGTFWKLDTQGDAKVPVAMIQEADDDDDDDGEQPPLLVVSVGDSFIRATDSAGMNRSASEYAFQEFLKVSEASGGGFARPKSRFMVNDDNDDQGRNSKDDDDDDTADPTSPESAQTSENNTENHTENNMESGHGATPDLNEPPSPPRGMGGVVDQVEVITALNPLFSGIRDEVESAATASNSPQEYEYFLKHKLDLACAAVALSRGAAGGAKLTPPPAALQASHAPEAYGGWRGSAGGPLGIPALPLKPEFGAPVAPTRPRATTSGSELSDDDNADAELGHNMAPGDVKRVRRMLSNRESARRSRRRKQAHLSEIETQVAQLRVENTAIVKRLTELTLKFQEAAIENSVLKSDVAALQAKLKMVQNRAAGTANGQAGSDGAPDPSARYMMMPSHAAGGHGAQYAHPARLGPAAAAAEPQPQAGGKMGRTPSMQRVASLEHLQKRIRGAACNGGPSWGGGREVEGPSMVEQHEDW